MSSDFDPEGPQSGWLLRVQMCWRLKKKYLKMSAGQDPLDCSLHITPKTFKTQYQYPEFNFASCNIN